MWFKALSAGDGEAFARQLASVVLDDLGNASDHGSRKFQTKAGKVLQKAEREIDAFKAGHTLNWYQRSRTGNAFLWALKDRQCPESYAQELTQWFVARL